MAKATETTTFWESIQVPLARITVGWGPLNYGNYPIGIPSLIPTNTHRKRVVFLTLGAALAEGA